MAAEVGICAGCRKPIFAIQEMAWFSADGLDAHDDATCYRKIIETPTRPGADRTRRPTEPEEGDNRWQMNRPDNSQRQDRATGR